MQNKLLSRLGILHSHHWKYLHVIRAIQLLNEIINNSTIFGYIYGPQYNFISPPDYKVDDIMVFRR